MTISKAEQERRWREKLTIDAETAAGVIGLREEVETLRRHAESQMVRFDNMFRASEQMRNRQVDVINRLLKGGTMPEELTLAQREIAELTVRCENTQAHLNTRTRELEDARADIAALRLSMYHHPNEETAS